MGITNGDLEGLAPSSGASLFHQSAPQRAGDVDLAQAKQLSRKVDGHPLSLRLLGGAFNLSAISLPAFAQDCEAQLLAAENKYVGPDHRHRNLYACIETSVRYLDEAHRRLFSGLWLFHEPFLPETAASIFDPEHEERDEGHSPVYDQLNALWRRGLLARETPTIREGTLLFYRLLPTMRPYIEKYLAIAVMVEAGLPRDAAGRPVEDLQQYLNAMRQDSSPNGPSTMSSEQLRPIIANTIAVMTTLQDRRDEWRETMTKALQDVQQRGASWQIEVEFFTAVLEILDGKTPSLPDNHPYAGAIAAIQDGIAQGGLQDEDTSSTGNVNQMVQAIIDFVNAGDWEATRQVLEARQAILFRPEVETLFEQNIAQARGSGNSRAADMLEMHLDVLRASKANGIAEAFEQLKASQEEEVELPFDIELIPRSVRALLGGPQEKMEHGQYLMTLAAQTQDEELKALLNTIQLALFGSELSTLRQQLSGAYQLAWEAIVAGVEQGGKGS